MTVLPNKHYSGHRRATDIEDDQRTLGKRSRERNVDSRFQIQLEEDGGGSKLTGQSCSLWRMLYRERQGLRKSRKSSPVYELSEEGSGLNLPLLFQLPNKLHGSSSVNTYTSTDRDF